MQQAPPVPVAQYGTFNYKKKRKVEVKESAVVRAALNPRNCYGVSYNTKEKGGEKNPQKKCEKKKKEEKGGKCVVLCCVSRIGEGVVSVRALCVTVVVMFFVVVLFFLGFFFAHFKTFLALLGDLGSSP